MQPPAPEPACTSVLYDGACPLCRREVQLYQKLTPAQPICWVDVSRDPPPGHVQASQQQLMQRFHVLTAEGELVDGARAFVHLWRQLPGWRWLAFVARLPGAIACMEGLYRVFLRCRPALQAWARQRERERSPQRGQA